MSIQLTCRHQDTQKLEKEYWKLPLDKSGSGKKYESALSGISQFAYHLEVIDQIKTDLARGLSVEEAVEVRLNYCRWLLEGFRQKLRSWGWGEEEEREDAKVEFTDPWP